jgi:hypothetical protein
LCVINLSDYTRQVRAKILYNHIHFSDLPRDHKLALVERGSYDQIVRHRNYNPRVIEYMTQVRHAGAVAPDLYLKEFVDSLENPTRIWDHAFRRQISEASRNLLFVLATLRDEASLENLEKAFWKFHEFRQHRFGFSAGPGDWIDALKQLDGNFIKTGKIGADIIVSFHNPSIRDFMETFLEGSDSDVLDLLRAALFYEQYTSLWIGIHGCRYKAISREGHEYLALLAKNVFGASSRTIRRSNREGEIIGVTPHPPSNEVRAEFFIRVVDELKPTYGAQVVESVLQQLSELWNTASADREDLLRLLEMLTARGLVAGDAAFVAARRCLLTRPETNDEFRAAADFCEKYPDAVSPEERDVLKDEFQSFATEQPSDWDDDPDWLRQVAADLEYVGGRLHVDVRDLALGLEERAAEIETERAEPEAPDDDDERWGPSESRVNDIQGMFDGLRSDLRDN